MSAVEPLPSTVQAAAIRACRDALHWRDDLRTLFLTAEVPRNLYDKHDLSINSKAKMARLVSSDLQERDQAGFEVQRRIVEDLRRMSKPHPDAPDQAAGKKALAELKQETTASKVLVDPEKAAADARRAASQRRIQIQIQIQMQAWGCSPAAVTPGRV